MKDGLSGVKCWGHRHPPGANPATRGAGASKPAALVQPRGLSKAARFNSITDTSSLLSALHAQHPTLSNMAYFAPYHQERQTLMQAAAKLDGLAQHGLLEKAGEILLDSTRGWASLKTPTITFGPVGFSRAFGRMLGDRHGHLHRMA